jgi:hypothetical protein
MLVGGSRPIERPIDPASLRCFVRLLVSMKYGGVSVGRSVMRLGMGRFGPLHVCVVGRRRSVGYSDNPREERGGGSKIIICSSQTKPSSHSTGGDKNMAAAAGGW